MPTDLCKFQGLMFHINSLCQLNYSSPLDWNFVGTKNFRFILIWKENQIVFGWLELLISLLKFNFNWKYYITQNNVLDSFKRANFFPPIQINSWLNLKNEIHSLFKISIILVIIINHKRYLNNANRFMQISGPKVPY